MRILEVAGSGSVGTNNMGPVSNDIFQLSIKFHELDHDVTIADAKTNIRRTLLPDGIELIETESISRATLSTIAIKSNPIFILLHKLSKTIKQWFNEFNFIREIASKLDLDTFDIVHADNLKYSRN